MIKKIIASFFIFIVLATSSQLDAKTLHAVLVIDSYAQNIEKAMELNYKMIKIEIQNIAYYADLKVVYHVYKDDTANIHFLDDLKNLKIRKNDVLLFYWSGHGFRTDAKDQMNNPWPSFAFNNGPKKGIDFLALTNELKAKNPRLLISIADTCNNYIRPEFLAPPHVNMMRKGPVDPFLEKRLRKAYSQLFQKSEGIVMFAGSHPGQFSWAYTQFGSFFTISFITALEKEVREEGSANWETVALRTFETLEKLNPPETQEPLVEIYLK